MRIRSLGLTAALACALTTGSASAQAPDRIVITTDARSGPGGYYAAGARLPVGARVTVTQRSGAWARAEFDGRQSEWIPAYVLQSSQAQGNPADLLRTVTRNMLRSITEFVSHREPPTPVSRVAATLGIRGFSSAYAAHRGVKVADADSQLWDSTPFDPPAYQAFIAARFAGRNRDAFLRRVPLSAPAPAPDAQADKLGAALTTFVARQDGLIRNPALEAYLSEVATLVAESSHAVDLPVRVYILASAEPKGFCSPNGIIFISAGALKRMQSEAEFAFFVGHEIAHVAFQHGLRKVGREDARVKEGEAFDEMEQDLGWDQRANDRYVRTAQELTDLADQVHEYFQRESNDRDELEADYWGLIYAARAGYVPEAAESLLLRIVAEGGKGDSTLLWNGVGRAPRLEGCRRVFREIKIDRSEFRSFDADFQAAAKNKAAGG